MYYEFYMDVFFVVNLVMDFFLLCLVKRSMGSAATPFHILAGAMLGAAGMCGTVWIPFGLLGVRMGIAHGILGVLMVKAGCRLKTVGEVVQGVLYLYAFSFFIGGILLALPDMANRGIIRFLAASAAAYCITTISSRLLKYLKGRREPLCQVMIRKGKKCIKVKGLYDTGNRLRDTVSGKPVCVLEYQVFAGLLDHVQREGFDNLLFWTENTSDLSADSLLSFRPHMLVYQSVGIENGILLVVSVDEMYLTTGKERRLVKKPMLGLVPESLSADGTFQMIINPGVFEG
ncbi:MAG: sigma-E processing peptidase SpoIIGA [Blautia sp.]